MPVKRAIVCLLIAALLAVGGAAIAYAQASDEALLEAATAAFEAWAQANEIPYKDLATEVQSQDDYFATVQISVATRPTQSDPWQPQEFASECKHIGATWKCSIRTEDVGAQGTVELPRAYSSWFDRLASFSGSALVSAQTSSQPTNTMDAKFAVVNNGELNTSDYFVQLDTADPDSDNLIALLILDNISAEWSSGSGSWNAERRAEDPSADSFIAGLKQADNLLTSVFQQNSLLDMATQQGVDVIGGREAVHYSLDLPDMMLRLLFSQFGSSPPSSIQFDKAQIEFWLDSTVNVMLKMRAELQAHDTVTAEQIAASMSLDIQNVDNVTLALPEEVRRAAMAAGIIKPDFAADIIVVGEAPGAEQ